MSEERADHARKTKEELLVLVEKLYRDLDFQTARTQSIADKLHEVRFDIAKMQDKWENAEQKYNDIIDKLMNRIGR